MPASEQEIRISEKTMKEMPPVHLQTVLQGHSGMVTGLAWEPNGRVLASCSLDKRILVWDLSRETFKEINRFENRENPAKAGGGQPAGLTSICWAPEGEALAAVSEDGLLQMWRYPGLEPFADLPPMERGFVQVLWSPSGKCLLTIAHQTDIHVWDVRQGKIQTCLQGHQALPQGACFSVRGDWLASYDESGQVRLWKGGAFTPEKQLRGHTGPVNHAVWSSQDWLATASDDGTIRIWDVHKGVCSHVLDGHGNAVKTLAISPDGRLLTSRAWDGHLRFWRCDNWATVAILEEDTVSSWPTLVFHPKEPILASLGLAEQVIRIWALDLDRLAFAAESVLPRCFTANEMEILREKAGNNLGFADLSPPPRAKIPGHAIYLQCTQCEGAFTETQVADRQARGLTDIICPLCDQRVLLEESAEWPRRVSQQ